MSSSSNIGKRLYYAWALLHLFFFLISREKTTKSAIREFWPIQDYSNLRYDYDFTELIVYVFVLPLLLVLFNKLLFRRA